MKDGDKGRIKAIIWDLFDVLVHPKSADVFEQLARDLGTSLETLWRYFDDPEILRKSYLGQETTAAYLQRIVNELNLPQSAIALLSDAPNFLVVESQLISFIRSSRPVLKSALCSDAPDWLRGQLNEGWKIADLFDVIIISSEVGLIKPDPEMYLLTLDRLKVLPQEAIFIDDKENNVIGAQAVGMLGIQFKDSAQTLQEIDRILKTTAG